MNKIFLIAFAGIIVLSASVFLTKHTKISSQTTPMTNEVLTAWKQFKNTFQKQFADSEIELYRIEVFAQNLSIIKADTTGTYGITIFSDLSVEEFKSTYLSQNRLNVEDGVHDLIDQVTAVDWVAAGKVSAVKNQGQCGAGWAFSSTGALESALLIANIVTSTSINLSEQQLVDCSILNSGCYDGQMDYAFKYIRNNPLTTGANYPYIALDATCNNSLIVAPKYGLTGTPYKSVSTTTTALATALQTEPVSVFVDATNWQFYTTGVFSNCSNTLNHGTLLVGVDSSGQWTIKNSFGTAWGQSGFITLAAGNTCGIANFALYPTGAAAK